MILLGKQFKPNLSPIYCQDDQEEWEVLRILALMVPAQIGFTALNSHIFTLVISKSEKYTHQDVED